MIGAGCALGYGLPGWQALACGAVATVSAGGRLSPDMDQTRLYRLLLPRPVEGHRRLTHWWGWPTMALLALGVYTGWELTSWPVLPITSLIFGWGSHILADAVFGAPGGGRGAGVPLAPLGRHRGLLGAKHGLRSDGRVARFCTRAIFPVVITCLILACLRHLA